MILLGHRGARKYAPENTIAAFEMALEHGCDGFEFDVRLTADRDAVLCHDPKFCGVSVAKSSYQKLYDAGAKRGKEIAVLEEILGFGSRAFLNIELKVGGAEELLIELLKKDPAEKGLVISSFLPRVVQRLYELDAKLPLGLICGNRRQLAKWKGLPIRAVMLHGGLVSSTLLEQLNAAQKQVFVWTVNSAREMEKFAEMGVDGIISDDTKLLVKTLG